MANSNGKKFETPTDLFLSQARNTEPELTHAANEAPIIPKGYKVVRESRTERLQLLITPTLKESLKEYSKAQGTSVNEIANQLLEKVYQLP